MASGKYAPLADLLRRRADSGQTVVDIGFAEIADVVGGLPPSAYSLRTWWGNSSHVQALAWRDAGFHVDTVSLDRQRVRFTVGRVGGSYHDRGRKA